MSVKKIFGTRLRTLRGSMNQQELADSLGISRASVGYYENATRTPDIEILEKASKHFGVSYDFLLGKSEYKRTANADIGARIGLSEDAISILESVNSVYSTAFLNNLITDPLFKDIIQFYYDIGCTTGQRSTEFAQFILMDRLSAFVQKKVSSHLKSIEAKAKETKSNGND